MQVRVLVDESVPRRFARLLSGYEVTTVQQAGWAALSNGALLRAAEAAGFTAFVTVDQSLPFQQNLAARALGTVILVAPSNRFGDLEPLVPATLAALSKVRPGDVVRVGARGS